MLATDRSQLTAFAALTLGGSLLVHLATRGLDPHGTGATLGMILTMWLPTLAAFFVSLVALRSLRGFGWGLGRPRYLAAGYLAPLIYGGAGFAIAALIGAGHWDFTRWANGAGGYGMEKTALNGLLIQMTVLIIPGFVMSLGEEIGWRGFMVPRLDRLFGFWGTVNIGGAIWFAYHLPGLLGGGYGPKELPLAWTLAMFTVLIWSGSLFYAWLRLRSGSFWPAALSHAAHNTFIQMMFASGFEWNGQTPWIAGEFGWATITAMVVVTVLIVRVSGVHSEPRMAVNPA